MSRDATRSGTDPSRARRVLQMAGFLRGQLGAKKRSGNAAALCS